MVFDFPKPSKGCLHKFIVTTLFCAMLIGFDMCPFLSTTKVTAALSYDDSDRRFGYSIIEVVPLQDETEPEQVYHHNFSEPITDPNNIKRLPNVSNEDAKQQTPEIFQLNDNEPQSKEPRTPNSKTRCKCKSVIYILVSYSLHYDFNTI